MPYARLTAIAAIAVFAAACSSEAPPPVTAAAESPQPAPVATTEPTPSTTTTAPPSAPPTTAPATITTEPPVIAVSVTLSELPMGDAELDGEDEVGSVTVSWHAAPADAVCEAGIVDTEGRDVVTSATPAGDSASLLEWRTAAGADLIAEVVCERGPLSARSSGPLRRTLHVPDVPGGTEATAASDAADHDHGDELVAEEVDADEVNKDIADKTLEEVAANPDLWPDPETREFPSHGIENYRNSDVIGWPYPHPAWHDFGVWCYDRAASHPDRIQAAAAAGECYWGQVEIALGLHPSAGAEPNCVLAMAKRDMMRTVPLPGEAVPAAPPHGGRWSWADCTTALWPTVADPASATLSELCVAVTAVLGNFTGEPPPKVKADIQAKCDALSLTDGHWLTRCNWAANRARQRLPDDQQYGSWRGC